MSALTDLFTAFANKIRSKTGGSDTYTPPQMVNAIDDVYQAGVDAGTTPTQTKTVTAGTSATTVTPDTGYALSSVTINPTPSQSKSATPTTSSQTITPDSGKLLSSVSVGAIQTETKSDTPNVSTNKTVSPSSGKYLSQVTIQPLTHTGTYTPAANTAQNDMGAYHDKRYVNTSGMIVPSGAKSITANGTGIDVSSYATANVNVPNPTLSGNATAADVKRGKTFYGSNYTKQTGTYDEPTINNITPQNDSAPSLTSGSVYQPSTDGYAIKTFKNVTPRNSNPYSVQIGDMAHIETNDGYVVATEPIAITPSSTSPPSIETNKLYKANNNGYAIDSYPTSVTPTADGTYFSTGIKKMSAAGYAYSQKPTPVETVLWTNPNAITSTFAAQTLSLSQSIMDFDYVKITYVPNTYSTITNICEELIDVNTLIRSAVALSVPVVALAGPQTGNARSYCRRIVFTSNTQLQFMACTRVGGTGDDNNVIIPYQIIGIKGGVMRKATSVINLGVPSTKSTVTYDLSGYPGYQDFVVGTNILFEYTFKQTAQCQDQGNFSTTFKRTMSYNSSTGVLTVTSTSSAGSNNYVGNFSAIPVYLVMFDN